MTAGVFAHAAALATAGETDLSGHRLRLIAALAESIEQKGYRDTTVADVVRLARTSRRSFYEQFDDRDACFLALFDATTELMLDQIARAVDADCPLQVQVDQAVDAYVAHVTAEPALFCSFVRELPGVGELGAERAQLTLQRFAELLIALVDNGRRAQPGMLARPLDMDTALIIVGGLRELLAISLQQGRDMAQLRARAARAVKAILTGTLM